MGQDHHGLLAKQSSHPLSTRKGGGLMAHKALKAHTSPAPKSSTRTLSSHSSLSSHIFTQEIAATSPQLQIGPWIMNDHQSLCAGEGRQMMRFDLISSACRDFFDFAQKGLPSMGTPVVDGKRVHASPPIALSLDNGPLPSTNPPLCHPACPAMPRRAVGRAVGATDLPAAS